MTAPRGVDRYRGVGDGAVLGTGLAPLCGTEHGGDVAHVGDAGLHRCGEADAVEPALRPRRLALGAKRIERPFNRAIVDGGAKIAGIEHGAGGGAVGHGVRWHQIALDHLQRVEAEGRGHALH